jgi:hypothetical protein
MTQFLTRGKDLVMRATEAILAEYGRCEFFEKKSTHGQRGHTLLDEIISHARMDPMVVLEEIMDDARDLTDLFASTSPI